MPQAVQYRAVRSIAPGHSANTIYNLNLSVKSKDRGRKVKSKQQIAIAGNTSTTYQHGKATWRISTTPLSVSDAEFMRELLDSVEDGQIFQFDPNNGAGASPDDLRNVVLDKAGYRERRAVRRGDDQSNDRFEFSWTMREI